MVNGNISDLFFNTDVSSASKYGDKHQFIGYDDTALREEATLFLWCLDRLGVVIPTVEELLTDFHARV